MKDRIITFLITIGFVVTSCVLLWPSFMESLNNITQTTVIGTYEEALKSEDITKMRKAAEAYNREIAEEQKRQFFTYRGGTATDAAYDSVLTTESGISTMAFVDIEKIGVYLPISHGTKTNELEFQIGHLYGTSLPVGGPSTHCVIAGHTGLKTADLFTDLTKMEIGDRFKIHVLGEALVYEVDNINIVLPEDEDPYLQIVDGQDYVTLYTCTPYGVNDHRLLVRGVRVATEDESDIDNKEKESVAKNKKAIIKTILIGSVPFIIFFFGIFTMIRDKKKEEKKKYLKMKQAAIEEILMKAKEAAKNSSNT